jgi:hypothetical protein
VRKLLLVKPAAVIVIPLRMYDWVVPSAPAGDKKSRVTALAAGTPMRLKLTPRAHANGHALLAGNREIMTGLILCRKT